MPGPLFDLICRTAEDGRETAREVYGLSGWVSHHNLDIWGHSEPVGYFGQDEDPCSYSMWPMSSGWCMAWKACLWARLRDGEHALGLLKNQLRYTREENISCLSQHAVCTPAIPDRWELWLCSCSCRDAYPEQERVYPVTSGTSG
mgnify:CR=1 FL=1